MRPSPTGTPDLSFPFGQYAGRPLVATAVPPRSLVGGTCCGGEQLVEARPHQTQDICRRH